MYIHEPDVEMGTRYIDDWAGARRLPDWQDG